MDLVTKNYLKAEDFKDKVVIWDLDGVLAPYRFNGHIIHMDIGRSCNNEEVEAGVFFNRIPCKHVQNITSSVNAKLQVCITRYILEIEAYDKLKWVKQNYPRINHTILHGAEDSRAIVLNKYCRDKGISKDDVIIIDDDVRNLGELEAAGFNAWHVSSIMDFYENK